MSMPCSIWFQNSDHWRSLIASTVGSPHTLPASFKERAGPRGWKGDLLLYGSEIELGIRLASLDGVSVGQNTPPRCESDKEKRGGFAVRRVGIALAVSIASKNGATAVSPPLPESAMQRESFAPNEIGNVRRQLFIPVVLPHSELLPNLPLRNITVRVNRLCSPGMTTMLAPEETEAGSAGMQPC
jgi:hypothetical protein